MYHMCALNENHLIYNGTDQRQAETGGKVEARKDEGTGIKKNGQSKLDKQTD